MRDEDISQLVAFAKAYQSLGWSVQKQLSDLLRGENEDLNPSAVRLIHDRMFGMNEELDELLLEYMDNHK